MKSIRERVNLEAEEVRGVRHGEALSFKGKVQKRGACMLSAKCRSAVTQMPEGIKSNTETVVTDTWTGSPWSGGVYMCA